MTGNVVSLHQHGNGLPRTLNKDEALVLVRELANMGGRVLVKEHAWDRMEERDISMAQVMEVLRRGEITKGPDWSEHQNWTLTLRADAAGQYVGVGVAIDTDLMGLAVVVITVFC